MGRSGVVIVAAMAALAGAGGVLAATRDDDAPDRLAKALSGYVAEGKTTTCVPTLYPTLDSKVYGKTILYQARGGGPIYRTETAGGCEGAASGDILVSVQYQSRPCSGDIVQTIDQVSRFPTGSCALGEFTTYRKVTPPR